jgi:hypothetical protein
MLGSLMNMEHLVELELEGETEILGRKRALVPFFRH